MNEGETVNTTMGAARCCITVSPVGILVTAAATRTRTAVGSAVVGILALGGRHHREAGDDGAREDPARRAGGKGGREQAVVDLPRHGEAVVASRKQEDAGVVPLGAMGVGGVDVALGGGDDAVVIGVDESDGRLVAVIEAVSQV